MPCRGNPGNRRWHADDGDQQNEQAPYQEHPFHRFRILPLSAGSLRNTVLPLPKVFKHLYPAIIRIRDIYVIIIVDENSRGQPEFSICPPLRTEKQKQCPVPAEYLYH